MSYVFAGPPRGRPGYPPYRLDLAKSFAQKQEIREPRPEYNEILMDPQPYSRRELLGLLGAGASASRLGIAAETRPNILYIMADDHASHAIGAYGSKINRTPNIDRIAQQGMRFDN